MSDLPTSPERGRGTRRSLRKLVGFAMILILVVGVVAVIRRVQEAANQGRCRGNLKMISFAVLNYTDRWGSPPPIVVKDRFGKPMHSCAFSIAIPRRGTALRIIPVRRTLGRPAQLPARGTVSSHFSMPVGSKHGHWVDELRCPQGTPDALSSFEISRGPIGAKAHDRGGRRDGYQVA